MTLPLPNLDDRRWADLVAEGRALIPRYAPGWSDHNVHDPGITLLELFAWLTETTTYRLNRVPERHRRKFLDLIGFAPRPPRAARTVVAFAPAAGTDPFALPAGTELEAVAADGEAVAFRTLRSLTVTAVELAAVQVATAEEPSVLEDRTREWRDAVPVALLGRDPRPGAAFYLGFSALPSEVPLAFVLGFQGPGSGPTERRRIGEEAAARHAACLPVRPAITCGDESEPLPTAAASSPPHHSAELTWEVFTGGPEPWTRLEPLSAPQRPQPGEIVDDSRSLTLDGSIEVNPPASIIPTDLGSGAPLFYLRCRLAAGAYDAPPVLRRITLNGVAAEQAVPVWQTFAVAPGAASGPAPAPGQTARLAMELDDGAVTQLTFLGTGADAPEVKVLDYQAPTAGKSGRLVVELVLAGLGSGLPGQRSRLPAAPVAGGCLRLYTHRDGQWHEWTQRADLDASGRGDRHFVLEPTVGEIVFGDGERGRAVPEGALVFAAYQATRAGAGNVGAGTIQAPADSPVNDVLLGGLPAAVREQLAAITRHPEPASGGADEEDLNAALGRAVERQHAHERLIELCRETGCRSLDQVDPARARALLAPRRAVGLLDVERIALDVPGTRVARARAWPGVHPVHPCLRAPNVVTVVIVPDLSVARPVPSPGLLAEVRRHLERRRMVTARVEVVAPEYLEVGVTARVRIRPHTDAARVAGQVAATLDTFLDPRRGGPRGLGWPFGRAVYRSEILQQIDGVDGVDHVLELSLTAGAGRPQCGNLPLCPTWLTTPGAHLIDVERGAS